MTFSWMKKASVLLALCMMLGCATGCNGNSGNSGETAEGTVETGEAGTAEAEDVIKVGYIFNGEVDMGGYSAGANGDRLAASGYTDVESYYIDNVNISDFSAAVNKLVDEGCSYIVSGSWLYTNVLTDVAGKNMDVNFISYGARVRTVNVYAYTDHVYEGAYIAGMAAAYNTDTEKIGIVVDPGMIYTKPVVNAAALGSQLVYKDAELITTFATKDNEIHSAVDALEDQGCDIIISYTESPETVEYCESKGIKVIGNLDYSKNAADYENLLMYFYTDHDSLYLANFKSMQMDTWEPEEYVGNLANGVVSVSPALGCAKDGTQDIIDALIPKVTSGDAYIFSGEMKNTSGNIMIQQGGSFEPAEVYTMDWYVLGVKTLETFVEPKLDLEHNDLEIMQ